MERQHVSICLVLYIMNLLCNISFQGLLKIFLVFWLTHIVFSNVMFDMKEWVGVE